MPHDRAATTLPVQTAVAAIALFWSAMAGAQSDSTEAVKYWDLLTLWDGTEIQVYVHDRPEEQRLKPVREDEIEFEVNIGGFYRILKIKRRLIKNIEYERGTGPLEAVGSEVINPPEPPPDPRNTGSGTAAIGPRAVLQELEAQVQYLSNFAWWGAIGDAKGTRVGESTRFPSGSWFEVGMNSRATLVVDQSIQIGAAGGSRMEFASINRIREGDSSAWTVECGIPYGRVWLAVGTLGARDRVRFDFGSWDVLVDAGDALLAVTFAQDGNCSIALFSGPSTLTVQIHGRSGYPLSPGQELRFAPEDPGRAIGTYDVTPGAEQEWHLWERFEPVRFNLEFRPIYPPLDRLPSYGIEFGLRDFAGWTPLAPRGRYQANVLDDIDAYKKGVAAFREKKGSFPGSLQELAEGAETFVPATTPRTDPWDQPYRLHVFPNDRYIVYSSGPNRVDEQGLGDDVH